MLGGKIMERSLAHVEEIISLTPIDVADRIETAQILGWYVVVKKDEFKVGDKIVYVEVDSVLPETEWSEFMRERKFRVKTIKLRKQISQGIVFPLDILPKKSYKTGQDVTEVLGITKYETPTERNDRERESIKASKLQKFLMRNKWYRRLFSRKKESFPSFIKKTDETRLQNMPQILTSHPNEWFDVTEKLDGTSFTAFLIQHKFLWWTRYDYGICSRNFRRDKAVGSAWYEISKKYKIKELLKDLICQEKYVVLQGEIIGPDIQKNKYKLKELELYVFNLIFPDGRCSHDFMSKLLIRNSTTSLKPVPLVCEMHLLPTVQEMVDFAGKDKSVLADIPREGIVCRSGDISFKVINPNFLLKYEED